MKILKICSNIVLFVFLFFIVFTYLGFTAVERTLLSESYYENIVYEKDMLSNVHSNLKDSLPDLVIEKIFENIDTEEIQKQFKEAIISKFDAIEFIDWNKLIDVHKNINENLIKDMVEIRVRLLTDSIVDAFDVAWIEETALESISEVLYFIKNGDGDFVLEIEIESRIQIAKESFALKLKELNRTVLGGFLFGWLDFDQIANQIFDEIDFPESIDVGKLINESEDFHNIIRNVENYRFLRKLFLVLPYILFIVIFVLFMLLSDIFRAMKRFGSGIFLPSFIFTLSVLAGKQVVINTIKLRVEQLPINFGTVEDILTFTFNRALTVPLIFMVVGMILIISGTIGNNVPRGRFCWSNK